MVVSIIFAWLLIGWVAARIYFGWKSKRERIKIDGIGEIICILFGIGGPITALCLTASYLAYYDRN